MKKFIVYLSLILLVGCVSFDSFWKKSDPISFKIRTVKGLKVFTYSTLEDLNRHFYAIGGSVEWGYGHSRTTGLTETRRDYSVGGSHPLFEEGILFGFCIEKPINSIHYVEGDGRYTCEEELEHSKESKEWDNSLIDVNEVCF